MEHKKLAVQYFNSCWDLIDKKNRSNKDSLEMIRLAHASLYHWSFTGTMLNQARGEWQISRVYSLLEMGEPAFYHGKRSLDICLVNGYGDFDLAFAYEAVARASHLLQDEQSYQAYYELGIQSLDGIEKEADKTYTKSELESIKKPLV